MPKFRIVISNYFKLYEMAGFLHEWSKSGYERAIFSVNFWIDTPFKNHLVLVLLSEALLIW